MIQKYFIKNKSTNTWVKEGSFFYCHTFQEATPFELWEANLIIEVREDPDLIIVPGRIEEQFLIYSRPLKGYYRALGEGVTNLKSQAYLFDEKNTRKIIEDGYHLQGEAVIVNFLESELYYLYDTLHKTYWRASPPKVKGSMVKNIKDAKIYTSAQVEYILKRYEHVTAIPINDVYGVLENKTIEEAIIGLLAQGFTQGEIASYLKKHEIEPSSVSSVKRIISDLKNKYKASTLFKLAIELKNNNMV